MTDKEILYNLKVLFEEKADCSPNELKKIYMHALDPKLFYKNSVRFEEQNAEEKNLINSLLKVNDINEESFFTRKILCPKCGQDKWYSYLEQRRSADEGETTIYYCRVCTK
jgi:DNA-directed RNA polymerase subunit M/transcription elongation factor TFIIS